MITTRFDLPILDWIAAHLRCPFLDAVMPAITFFGDGGWLWIAMALVFLFFPKLRKTGIAMGIGLLLGALCANVILKPLVGRIRPFDYQWLHFGKVIELLTKAPTDPSFPSGHTMASAVCGTVLLLRHRQWGLPAAVLAALIAFSRLYLYVHYPTDVLFSAALGISIGFVANFLVNQGPALYQQRTL